MLYVEVEVFQCYIFASVQSEESEELIDFEYGKIQDKPFPGPCKRSLKINFHVINRTYIGAKRFVINIIRSVARCTLALFENHGINCPLRGWVMVNNISIAFDQCQHGPPREDMRYTTSQCAMHYNR